MHVVSAAVLEQWNGLSDEQVVVQVLSGHTALFDRPPRRGPLLVTKGVEAEDALKVDLRSPATTVALLKMNALRAYQHSLPAPPPPAGSVDATVAGRGRVLFDRTCANCHVGGSGTDNNTGKLHTPAETGVDGAYAVRTANKAYRTTPLRGLWQHAPYFHDGSAATLSDVVAHYNRVRTLSLTAEQQRDLVEYLKSL